MKNKKIISLLLSIFLLASCGNNKNTSIIDSNNSVESNVSETSNENNQNSEDTSELDNSDVTSISEQDNEDVSEFNNSEITSYSELDSEDVTSKSEDDNEYVAPTDDLASDPIYHDEVAQDYYKNISKTATGTVLLKQLHDLINEKWKSVGYGGLWNYFPNCDADPDNPESGKIIAFYRGTPADRSEMNREHVWPDSRGGNLIEGDPHMTRPTLSSDNNDRGNSFYVEGKNTKSEGWDPYVAGLSESYRGDSARIILYAAVAKYGDLALIDSNSDAVANKTMGKLSDLIKWNYEYPVSKYEILRNEVLSGERSVNGSDYNFNRNPFIDDRNLACRIWGDTNEETQRLCELYTHKTPPKTITLSEHEITLSIFEETTLSVASTTPASAYHGVTWTSSNPTVAEVEKGKIIPHMQGETIITATSTLDATVSDSCKVIVNTPMAELESISAQESLSIALGDFKTINYTLNPKEAYPLPNVSFVSDNSDVASVDNNGLVSALSVGETDINITAKQGDIIKNATCHVVVSDHSEFVKVTKTPQSWSGKYLIVNEANNIALNSSAENINSNANSMSVTISNGKIASDTQTLNALVEVVETTEGYVMKTSTGKVIYHTGSNNSIYAGDEVFPTTFELNNNSNVIIKCGSEFSLQYNSSAKMFRYYKSTQLPIVLYKLN